MDSGASVATTCPYCGVGCGLRVSRTHDGALDIAGDPQHPANLGRLCSKAAALGETLGHEGRLLYPEIGGRRVSWDEALWAVARALERVRDTHGPGALAFYASGQLLTEDYYVANKLMKGFLGAANIDTNSRLCMASAVAAHQRAFGADAVPCSYEDLDLAELVVIVGSNTAWCHPVLFGRIQRAKATRPGLLVVTIDPRRTPTAEVSDLHLALSPGTDAILFNGLLDYLRRLDRLNWEFLEAHVEGFAAALATARQTAPSIPAVAAGCGLAEEVVARFYHWYAQSERVVTLFSQGINQSSSGTDRANAIINCHLATGRIGKPGSGPFSLTGQPNAMGGREVGGLATQLAAHMGFTADSRDRLARFWGSPNVAKAPGLKAVECFEAVEPGKIKALWIMATNPAVSLPEADRFRAALRRCEFVALSDCMRETETAACAHVLLPALAWGEKSGTVTNCERRISRQRAFLSPPGEARPDWWIVSQVACRLGYGAHFSYETEAQIFREHARLSGFENGGSRAFDISALADLSDREYEELQPLQWPVTPQAPRGSARLFGDGRFYRSSGKALMVPVTPRPPAHLPTQDYPLVLNTGRSRDQWHTMTRTSRSPRLLLHVSEPYVEIHPDDARSFGLVEGGLARVVSRHGEMIGRVRLSPNQRAGSLFVPIHWNDVLARKARAGAVVNAATDPVSGQPELKHTPARVEPYRPAWHGFVLSRKPLLLCGGEYQVAIKGHGCWRYELAGDNPSLPWPALARRWLGEEGEWLEFEDPKAGIYRAARIAEERLTGCLFVAPTHGLAPRERLEALFAKNALDPRERVGLLAGANLSAAASEGPVICACFRVGRTRLLAAIRQRGLRTPEAIGASLHAGTKCGSCLPELSALIASATG